MSPSRCLHYSLRLGHNVVSPVVSLRSPIPVLHQFGMPGNPPVSRLWLTSHPLTGYINQIPQSGIRQLEVHQALANLTGTLPNQSDVNLSPTVKDYHLQNITQLGANDQGETHTSCLPALPLTLRSEYPSLEESSAVDGLSLFLVISNRVME